MSLEVWSLASGSSGNSFLIRGGRTTVLLDAGFSARAMRERISSVGVDPMSVEAIFLTHEHSDHMSGAGVTSRALSAPLVANEKTLAKAERTCRATDTVCLPTGSGMHLGELEIQSFSVSHDAVDPVGYVFRSGRHTMCYVTDTGALTPEIIRHLAGAHLIVLESNHDVPRLMRSEYPDVLKQRILGDRGHLSNDVTARTIAEHSQRCEPSVVWLAHLSAENNTPRLALKFAQNELRHARPEHIRLEVAKRDVVSLHWNAGTSWWQPSLF